ncbi:MAG: hypothetical protein C0391_01815 [Anaerolinea sp.]|nr:hypothetical protein [Anaerolinea sp.]
MRRFISKSSVHAVGSIILTTSIILAAFSSPVSARARSAPAGLWTVSISGLDGLVCVGDSYMLTASWDAKSYDTIAPLTGPTILVQANQGSFDRETERPGTTSGTTLFNYTAEKAGTETILIQLFDSELNVDSEKMTRFEVKKCDYLYTLIARTDVETSGGELGFYYILKSKGLLIAPDPNQPHQLEGWNKPLTVDTTIAYYNSEDCTLVSSDVGQALGFVDAKAVVADNGVGIKLMIGPPQGMNYTHDLILTCPDGSHPQKITVPVTSSNDPWIEQVFPFSEGEYTVKIDFLDQGVQRMIAAGNSASYTARLSLQRVERK